MTLNLELKVKKAWSSLDILIHSIAYADIAELEGRFIDTSKKGFQGALDVSAYSLIQLSRMAEPLMKTHGGTILTMTYQGANRVIPDYKIMGVAKAALEASVKYLSWDLGPSKIRVNAVSAGPVKTLASSAVGNFRDIMKIIEEKTPLHESINIEEVGELAAFLCSDAAKHITGTVMYLDSGAHIMGS